MGVSDTFWDEDAECSKCHSKVREWQSKHFQPFLENWKKGEFLQYRKMVAVPEAERRRKDGSISDLGSFRRTNKYVSDVPLLFAGKVPVHMSCGNCDAWLEAYARIVKGRFTGIVEIEADGNPKEFVSIKPKTRARDLREEFQDRLSLLQESCDHVKTQWMTVEWALGHPTLGKRLVCLKCEKILQKTEGTARLKPSTGRKRSLPKGRKFESSLPGFNYREKLHEASGYLFGKTRKNKRTVNMNEALRINEKLQRNAPKGWDSAEVIRYWRDRRR
jgi:hypothetical protein